MQLSSALVLLPAGVSAQSLAAPASSPVMSGMAMVPPPCMLTCFRNIMADAAPGFFCTPPFAASLSTCVTQSCPAPLASAIKGHIPDFCAGALPHMSAHLSPIPYNTHSGAALPPTAAPYQSVQSPWHKSSSCLESVNLPSSSAVPPHPGSPPVLGQVPFAPAPPPAATPAPALPISVSAPVPCTPPGPPTTEHASPYAPPPAEQPSLYGPPAITALPCVSQSAVIPTASPIGSDSLPFALPPAATPAPYAPAVPASPTSMTLSAIAQHPTVQPPVYAPGTTTAWQLPANNQTKPYAPVGSGRVSGQINSYPVYASPTPAGTSRSPSPYTGAVGTANQLSGLGCTGTLLIVALMTMMIM